MEHLRRQKVVKKQKRNDAIEREKYLNIADEFLQNNQQKILMFYGVGGIGKSQIHSQLNTKYKESYIVIPFNLNLSLTLENMYVKIIRELKKSKVKLRYTELLYVTFWKLKNPNAKLKEIELPFLEEGTFMGDLLSEELKQSDIANVIPAGNLFLKILNKSSQKILLDSNILDEIKEFDKEENSEEMILKFSQFLAYDLIEYYKGDNKKLIFLFDGFELINKKDELLEFIQNLVIDLQEFDAHFILTGREELLWKGWEPYIQSKEIDSFSEDETVRFLENNGIESQALLQKIIKTSKGVPFYLELVVKLFKTESLDESLIDHIDQKEIINLFLRDLSYEEKSAIEILSVSQKFDKELFKYLMEYFKITYSVDFFEMLVNHSFIRYEEEHYHMHDLMKESLLHYLDTSRKQEVNDALFSWYETKIQYLNVNTIQNSDLSIFLDYTYHLVQKGSLMLIEEYYKKNIRDFMNNAGQYNHLIVLIKYLLVLNNHTDFNNELKIDLALTYIKLDQHKQCDQLRRELRMDYTLSPELLSRFYYLNAHRLRQGRYYDEQMVIEYYESALRRGEIDIRILSYIGLANIYRINNELKLAKRNIQMAIQIIEKEKRFDLYLANALDKFSFIVESTDDAIEYLIDSLSIKQRFLSKNHLDIGRSYRDLAYKLRNKKDNKHAKKYVLKCLQIYKNYYSVQTKRILSLYKLLIDILNEENEITLFIEENHNFIDYSYFKLVLMEKELLSFSMMDGIIEENIGSEKDILVCAAELLVTSNTKKAEAYLLKALSYCSSSEKLKIFHFLIRAHSYDKKKFIQYLGEYEALLEMIDDELKLFRAYYFIIKNKFIDIKKRKEYALKQVEISYALDKKNKLNFVNNTKSPIYLAYKNLINIDKRISFNQCASHFKVLLDLCDEENNDSKKLEIYTDMIKVYFKDTTRQIEILKLQEELGLKLNKDDVLDTVYGKLDDIYSKENNFECVKKYRLKQLEIREKGNDFYKLFKAYLYLSQLYLEDDSEQYLYYLNLGLDVLKSNHDYENIFYVLDKFIEFYGFKDNRSKQYLEQKYQLSIMNKNIVVQFKTLEQYIDYYMIHNHDSVLVYLKKQEELLTQYDENNLLKISFFKKSIVLIEKSIITRDIVDVLQKYFINDLLEGTDKNTNVHKFKEPIEKLKEYMSQNDILDFFGKQCEEYIQLNQKDIVLKILELVFLIIKVSDRDFKDFIESYVIQSLEVLMLEEKLKWFEYLEVSKVRNLKKFFLAYTTLVTCELSKYNLKDVQPSLEAAIEYYKPYDKVILKQLEDKYEELKEIEIKQNNTFLAFFQQDQSVCKIEPVLNGNLKQVTNKIHEIIDIASKREVLLEFLNQGIRAEEFYKVLQLKIVKLDFKDFGFISLVQFLQYVLNNSELRMHSIKRRYYVSKSKQEKEISMMNDYDSTIHNRHHYNQLLEQRGIFIVQDRLELSSILKLLIDHSDEIQEKSLTQIELLLSHNAELLPMSKEKRTRVLSTLYNIGIFHIDFIIRPKEKQRLTFGFKSLFDLEEAVKLRCQQEISKLEFLTPMNQLEFEYLFLD